MPTNTTIACDETGDNLSPVYLYTSLACNLLLLLGFAGSEAMGASKATKLNGIIHAIVSLVSSGQDEQTQS